MEYVIEQIFHLEICTLLKNHPCILNVTFCFHTRKKLVAVVVVVVIALETTTLHKNVVNIFFDDVSEIF